MNHKTSTEKIHEKRILILHTGGTLGMTLKGTPDDPDHFMSLLRKHVAPIFEMAEITVEIVANKDSSNILPSDWVAIARRLDTGIRNEAWDAYVVIHGTDTMSFTSSAVSFMLGHPGRPVIFTGAQRPLADTLSDAARNIIHSVQFAVEAKVKEVSVFFDGHLLRANRTKKVSIPSFHAFESPNFPPLAKIGSITEYAATPLAEAPYKFDPRIETRVASLKLFPGLEIELFFGLAEKGVKGLVLEAFGAGNIPLTGHSVVSLIQRLTERGIPTVICSQAHVGTVDLSAYETGRAAKQAGAISAADMTWESAVTKMMVLLGRGYSFGSFANEFSKPLVGEMSDAK